MNESQAMKLTNIIQLRYPVIFICVILFSSSQLYSQIDFRPGYVVRAEGDTLKGWVAYQSDKKNNQSCVFKSSRKAARIEYYPKDLAGFGIDDGSTYQSIHLPSAVPGQGNVFASMLVNGALTLFKFEDYFITLRNDEWITLPVPKSSEVVRSGVVMIMKDKKYLGILKTLTSDCAVKIGAIHYVEKDITDYVLAYNKCKQPDRPQAKIKPVIGINLRVFASYNAANLTYDNFQTFTFYNHTLTAGGGVEVGMPRIYDKIFFTLDAIYNKSFFQAYHELIKVGVLTRQDIFLDISALKIPFGLKYHFMGGRTSPYITMGGIWSKTINSATKTIEERESPDAIYRDVSYNDYRIKNVKGYWVGAGINTVAFGKTRAFIEIRYERGEGYLGTPVVNDSKMINYNILCGLRF